MISNNNPAILICIFDLIICAPVLNTRKSVLIWYHSLLYLSLFLRYFEREQAYSSNYELGSTFPYYVLGSVEAHNLGLASLLRCCCSEVTIQLTANRFTDKVRTSSSWVPFHNHEVWKTTASKQIDDFIGYYVPNWKDFERPNMTTVGTWDLAAVLLLVEMCLRWLCFWDIVSKFMSSHNPD